MSTPKLFTIAPDAPFLSVLADRVLDGTLLSGWPQQGPFWLSDVTIVLPTRRARLALAEAFLERGQRLLPDIRTFGGEQQDEEPFLPPHDLPGLPPAASALERRLFLARLIDAWARTPVGQQILATPRADGDVRPFVPECEGDRPADAAARAGHQHAPVPELQVHQSATSSSIPLERRLISAISPATSSISPSMAT